jgi:hypothetical protein
MTGKEMQQQSFSTLSWFCTLRPRLVNKNTRNKSNDHIISTVPRATEIRSKVAQDVGLFQSVSGARREDTFLARKLNTKNLNSRFHIVVQIPARYSHADEMRLVAQYCKFSEPVTGPPSYKTLCRDIQQESEFLESSVRTDPIPCSV